MVVTMTDDDIVHAGKYPTLGWPGYSNPFLTWQPTDILRGPIFRTGNLRSLGLKHGWVHREPFEPLARALEAAGARCVERRDFRTLGADFKMERPLVDRSFTSWALPPRLAQSCVRLGDTAAGTWAQRVASMASFPL